VARDGAEANGTSFGGSISPDGHFVTYRSDASNLVPGDTNGVSDIFAVQIDVGPPVDGVVKNGDDGNNILKGTHRNDILRGHGGQDLLFGHKGDDRLDGGDGNDKIFAGKGDDTVLGGAGHDLIWTGKGSDLVVFNEGDGRDRVFDFDQRRDANDHSFDRVQLDVSIGGNAINDFANLETLIASGDIGLSTRKGSLTLTFDNGDVLTLGGVHALSAEDWLFS
jgi:Ca2+-binding RTX toxin-like protein